MNTITLETTEMGEAPVDVYQKLSSDRILFLTEDITDELAVDMVASLLLKDAEDSSKKVSFFINSSGGDIRSTLMICDIMRLVDCPIETICIGSAINESALILASGTVGLRYVTKNAVIGMSQLNHNHYMHGNLLDAKKMLNLTVLDNKRMLSIFADKCSKTLKQVSEDLERQVFWNAQEAVNYGLVDKVVNFKK